MQNQAVIYNKDNSDISMDKPIVHGIPNCDTVKKARKWLDTHNVPYEFHDYKKKGISKPTLKAWSDALGWDVLLNRRGTTWRKLDEADKEGVDEKRAIDLMAEHTSMIKRPVIQQGDLLIVGFNEDEYQQLIS